MQPTTFHIDWFRSFRLAAIRCTFCALFAIFFLGESTFSATLETDSIEVAETSDAEHENEEEEKKEKEKEEKITASRLLQSWVSVESRALYFGHEESLNGRFREIVTPPPEQKG